MVVAEVALVVVLSISASVLIRSYYRLLHVDPGLDPSGVLTLNVTAQSYKYPTRPEYVGFFRDVLERLEQIPGVDSAAMFRPFPLRGDTFEGENMGFTIPSRPGHQDPPDGQEPEAAMRFTSPSYFRTMRIPLLSGRDFNELDDSDHPLVIIRVRLFWNGGFGMSHSGKGSSYLTRLRWRPLTGTTLPSA